MVLWGQVFTFHFCLSFVAQDVEDLEENEGEDLCNCEFSLAYGARCPTTSTLLSAPVAAVCGLSSVSTALRPLITTPQRCAPLHACFYTSWPMLCDLLSFPT